MDVRKLGFLALFLLFPAIACTTAHAAGEGHSVNLYANPFGLLDVNFDGGLDFRIAQNWTLGPTFDIYNNTSSGVKASATGFGGRINYYPHGAIASGLRLSLIVDSLPLTVSTGGKSAKVTATTVEGLIGYHWVGHHWNIGLGGGVAVHSGGKSVTYSDGTTANTPGFSGTNFVWELPVGYAF